MYSRPSRSTRQEHLKDVSLVVTFERCQTLWREADGGRLTAAVTAAYVAVEFLFLSS